MKEIEKLKEIYQVLENRVHLLGHGVLGPIIIDPEDTNSRYGFTDEKIKEMHDGGFVRNEYKPSILYGVGGYSDQDFEHDNDESAFQMLADIMLFAQAGILDYENYSDSMDLGRWEVSRKFKTLACPNNTINTEELSDFNNRTEYATKVDAFILEHYKV